MTQTFNNGSFQMNNLEALIRKSGWSKKEFADLNGITPTTLSRHMHGKVPMTVRDAEKYGEHLNVCARTVLFPSTRCPVIVDRKISVKDGVTIVAHRYCTPATKAIVIPAFYADDVVALRWRNQRNYTGEWHFYDGSYLLYPRFPIEQRFVDKACFQKQSLCKLKEPRMAMGCFQDLVPAEVYPQPNGRFTLHSTKNEIDLQSVELDWAVPLIQVILRPELRGITEIEM